MSKVVLGRSIAVRYQGFQGTLPNVTGVDLYLDDWQWQMTAAGFLVCLYAGDIPLRVATTPDGSGSMTTGDMTILPHAQRLVSGSGCPGTWTYSGSFTLAPQQTLTLVD